MADNTYNGGAYTLATGVDPVADVWLIQQGSVYHTLNRNLLLGVTGTPADISTSQTFSNKNIGNTNSITIKDASFTLQNSSVTSKQAQFSLASITAGNTRTYILPDISDTLITLTATQTVSNKTFTSPTINSPSITNASITADSVSGFTTANSGNIYGMSVSGGILSSAAILGQVNTAALQTNAVAASNLATNAIKLGMATITGNITTTSTSFVQATGLTAPVTIPSGGRSVKITVIADSWFNSGANFNTLSIWDGTVGSGTQLAQQEQSMIAGNDQFVVICMAVVTPGAGSKTYNVGWKTTAGTATILASAVAPAMILVEAI